ncbi:metalloregulator ArsR/SmtB family transcription factor [Phaeovibrio sulfidiphilus]|uniref:Metalloregulator ArsR/SmtB family transcription factor n=1 Tax=Phaeovibrio sulfidiphilus TaxID=1220600 RepID=A0A8J7CQS8_9PROT|nr:metalloregulator ArsR/SmtB family transcription factor [Phaeovibrio sulfidiphilus]MBE1237170.1 metalloregulator ArsR/SmtB family transcription factor [Phaeovibrio sulfidiphilus]
MDGVLSALRAVAEVTRLRILALCAGGELSVSDLVDILGISQPRVSRHLKVMVDARLLERRPEGAWVFYRFAGSGVGRDIARGLLDILERKGDALTSETLRADHGRLLALRTERAEAAMRYFGEIATRWDDLRRVSGVEEAAETALVERVARAGATDLLDIATGTGSVLVRVAPHVGHVVGIDRSREMLALARAGLDRAGVRNAEVRYGDMYSLPFQPDSFDLALLYQVLHFAEDPARVIANAAGVLRPSGRLLIADLAPHGIEDYRVRHNHRRLGFSHGEMEAWCTRAGLTVQETFDLPGPELTVRFWVAGGPPGS